METRFNVFEILQIAEKIERNAAKFYIRTAEFFDDMELRDECYKLAAWKARHEKILAQRRRRFSEKTGEFGTFDPDNYVLSHPRVMAGLAVFATEPGSLKGPPERQCRQDIFKDAIRRAREAVVFWQTKACENEAFDLPWITGSLNAQGIRTLLVETEQKMRTFETSGSRVAAFAETL